MKDAFVASALEWVKGRGDILAAAADPLRIRHRVDADGSLHVLVPCRGAAEAEWLVGLVKGSRLSACGGASVDARLVE